MSGDVSEGGGVSEAGGVSENAGMETRAEAMLFDCEQCGAKVSFAPGAESLTCGHCGHENAIEREASIIDELDFHAYVRQLASQAEMAEVSTVKCDACGVQMKMPPGLDAFACAYCGSAIVAGAVRERVIRPGSVLPFHVPEKEAQQAFRAWIRKLWFAPSDLNRYARADHGLNGVYVPYWTYDCRTQTSYTGFRGEHYWTTQTYTTRVNGKTVTRTRRVRRTRWYPAAGKVRNEFDDVLVLGSRSLPAEYAQKLEPWDLQALAPYQEEYLAGFRAEKYQVSLDDGFDDARLRMEPVIRAAVRSDIGGDEQRIASMSVRHEDITFKHVLLPVWITTYRYRDRIFRILVNARTGEVQGERPWSVWKIVFAVLGALAVVGIGAIVISALR